MPRRAKVVRHLPREQLQAMYRTEKDSRVKERLLAILHIYDGVTVEDTAGSMKLSLR